MVCFGTLRHGQTRYGRRGMVRGGKVVCGRAMRGELRLGVVGEFRFSLKERK